MKGTAIGLVIASFLCFMQGVEHLQQSPATGFFMFVIGGVLLYAAKLAWGKTLGDSDD